MALLADYHTHTPYSHGKNSIEENVASAVQKGLSAIAITDHGFNHALYAVKREEIAQQRKEIDDIKDKYPIEILLGVEANLISSDGKVDITDDDMQNLDIVVMGYHKMVKANKRKDKWFFIKNNICSFLHHTSRRQIAKNTRAYINALRNYDIDIISHLNKNCKVNVAEVAKVAVETNTYIELNGKCRHLSDEQIQQCIDAGCKFVLDSDAHTASRVGECNKGLQAMYRNRIPESMVANYNSLITLKKDKKKQMKKG